MNPRIRKTLSDICIRLGMLFLCFSVYLSVAVPELAHLPAMTVGVGIVLFLMFTWIGLWLLS